ncbi:MAG: hypothetical protein LBU92_03730 [Prevotellaceae bacterium]|nr:hypothetical protein [Prevotellaceae bacterium]
MRSTISAKLFRALQKGKAQLSAEALAKIADFVASQKTDNGAFKNKSGTADLYYTSFGLFLLYILDNQIDISKTKLYLSQQNTSDLDLIHYAAYLRCRMMERLTKWGKIGLLAQPFFAKKIRSLSTFSDVPHGDFQSPYTQFVWLSLLEDAGCCAKPVEALENYHLPNGGYKNSADGLTATTNATVAALAVQGQLRGYKENDDVLFLRNAQDESGGFFAAANSPVPDLLSTATALFVLNCYGVKPKYSARNFIEAHWLNSGGFSATLLEEKSDVEYTFYGLLALGASASYQ